MSAGILDIDQKVPIDYAVSLAQRDEQIRRAIARVKDRLQPNYTKRTEPIAIVCFGPSLNDTWEQIRAFKHIISCSGAHKFLLERGIKPTWDVEVDPRPHKVELLGTPCRETEYLICSTCHPALFRHLEEFNIKLWHSFNDDAESKRVLPHGEWALTGGSSVGLRAMTIAHFMGFCDLHVFGMDGNESDKHGKHAATHPMQPKEHSLVEYPKGSGQMWKTTASMMECAKQTWHELDMMPHVKATFYGHGLVQEMAKHYVPNYKTNTAIAISKPELISDEYRKLNMKLHEDEIAYGATGDIHASSVMRMAEKLKTRNILDYGCGKGRLAKAIPWAIAEYDPAIPGKQESPKPADIVVCTDVLEHVEPEKLQFVLHELQRVTEKIGFFSIHTGPSTKFLADGRNAHLIQQGKRWWKAQLCQFFCIGEASMIEKENNLYIIVSPLKEYRKPDYVAGFVKAGNL